MKNAIKNYISEIKWRLTGILGRLIIDLLCATTTIESEGLKKIAPILGSGKFIGACWHSRIILFSYIFKGWHLAILVSKSKDGEIIARILQSQGHETIRGSSSRGGLRALAKQIKILKKHQRPGVVIPDGPRGPRHKVQPGIITLAKKTGYPIIPFTYSAKKIKIFSSWDRFILPYPFLQSAELHMETPSISLKIQIKTATNYLVINLKKNSVVSQMMPTGHLTILLYEITFNETNR